MISSTRRSILSSSTCTGRVCFGLLITQHSSLQDLPSEVDELAFRRHPEDLGTCWHLHSAELPVLTVATAPRSQNGGPSHLARTALCVHASDPPLFVDFQLEPYSDGTPLQVNPECPLVEDGPDERRMAVRQWTPGKLRQEAEHLTSIELGTARTLDRKPEHPHFKQATAVFKRVGYGGAKERRHARLGYPAESQVHRVEPLLGSEGNPLTGTEADLAALAQPRPTTLSSRPRERVAPHTFQDLLRGSCHGLAC